MNAQASAGRRGRDVRSDCWVSLESRRSGGIRLALTSRVAAMYGQSIRKLVKDEIAFFGIRHAAVTVEDSGALPSVIMARVEAAVKRLNPRERRGFLPDFLDCCRYPTERVRFRRSRLYLPGSEPKFMFNAGIHR
ncbi:citrate lyase ACP, partial [candidate division WOR-3 bacterium]|nr:citrate lyase ACP [candidate division WOR-3 bacterium]